MANANRITVLASMISENTEKVNSYLVSNGFPTPSFDADTPVGLLLDPNIAIAHVAVLEAMDELNSLMLDPIMTVTKLNNLVCIIE